MSQLLIFAALAIFVAVLMRKKGIAQIKDLLLSQLTNHLAETPTIRANQKHPQQSMSLRNHKKKNISR